MADRLLQENGSALLQEDGFYILLAYLSSGWVQQTNPTTIWPVATPPSTSYTVKTDPTTTWTPQ